MSSIGDDTRDGVGTRHGGKGGLTSLMEDVVEHTSEPAVISLFHK